MKIVMIVAWIWEEGVEGKAFKLKARYEDGSERDTVHLLKNSQGWWVSEINESGRWKGPCRTALQAVQRVRYMIPSHLLYRGRARRLH